MIETGRQYKGYFVRLPSVASVVLVTDKSNKAADHLLEQILSPPKTCNLPRIGTVKSTGNS